eukprot:jgi/Botrbrau1/22192/Bobra.168_1s0024.1
MESPISGVHRGMLWFRKGLRLHDNPALLAASKAAYLAPVFVLDPWFLVPQRVGVNRLNFLLESLTDLNNSLTARGSRLVILKGNPVEVLPKVWKEWGITHLCFEADTEPYALKRDAAIKELAAKAGVEVISPVSHTLYDLYHLIKLNGGSPPLTYTSFQKLMGRAGPPPKPAGEAPSALPPLPTNAPALSNSSVPSLEQLGYPPQATTVFKGGESVALARMAESLSDKAWVAAFEKPKGDPSAFLKPATTVLSPHLKFGCLSPRLFYYQLQQVLKEQKKHTQPPVSLLGQLLWREFYYCAAAGTPNYDCIEGNRICKQIQWDENEEFFKAWEEGRTGYPWIDAIMHQLQQQGWMHHLARHCVACFLTRGDLYVSWLKGVETFDRLLIDADWALNNGNWMWLSASSFFYQYFRVYSPISFGQKYDPHGKYVRHFLPVLKDFPDKYIYSPWEAPLEVQKRANCIIGKDYPRPIVAHSEVSKRNIQRMKEAYETDSKMRIALEAEQGGGGAGEALALTPPGRAKRKKLA